MTGPLSTFRRLLVSAEAASESMSDEDTARLLCAVSGRRFVGMSTGIGDDGTQELRIRTDGETIYTPRRACPDVCLDAAVALTLEKLPGWVGNVEFGGDDEERQLCTLIPPDMDGIIEGEGVTPSLAVTVALLTGLIAREEGRNHV